MLQWKCSNIQGHFRLFSGQVNTCNDGAHQELFGRTLGHLLLNLLSENGLGMEREWTGFEILHGKL